MNAFGSYTDVEIARVAHEATRGLQAVHEANRASTLNPVDTGIPVAPDWVHLPPDGRDAVVEQVRAVRTGLVATAESAHANWLAWHTANGWTWGNEVDPIDRTHPNLMPWYALPAKQRDTYLVFVATVTALLRNDQRL